MPRTIPLIARKALIYRGRQIHAGEIFDADAVASVAFRYRGQAKFAPKNLIRSSAPAAPVVPTMTPLAEVIAQTEPPPSGPDHTPVEIPIEDPQAPDGSPAIESQKRTRRSYRRRDMEAEAVADE